MNMLRNMLCTMATSYGRESNVDEMLLTAVFAARLEKKRMRVAPCFHAPVPMSATYDHHLYFVYLFSSW